jgi:hypothetical protein
VTELEVGPVLDLSLRKQKSTVALLQQLRESNNSVEESRRCIRSDRHAIALQVDLVGLLRRNVAVAILRLADNGGVRRKYQAACRRDWLEFDNLSSSRKTCIAVSLGPTPWSSNFQSGEKTKSEEPSLTTRGCGRTV